MVQQRKGAVVHSGDQLKFLELAFSKRGNRHLLTHSRTGKHADATNMGYGYGATGADIYDNDRFTHCQSTVYLT